jgi:hypothetical protein
MIINVNKNYRIATGKDQFILQTWVEDSQKDGKARKGDGWRNIAYVSKVHEIWDCLYHRQIIALEGEYPFEALSLLHNALAKITSDIERAIKEAECPHPNTSTTES